MPRCCIRARACRLRPSKGIVAILVLPRRQCADDGMEYAGGGGSGGEPPGSLLVALQPREESFVETPLQLRRAEHLNLWDVPQDIHQELAVVAVGKLERPRA